MSYSALKDTSFINALFHFITVYLMPNFLVFLFVKTLDAAIVNFVPFEYFKILYICQFQSTNLYNFSNFLKEKKCHIVLVQSVSIRHHFGKLFHMSTICHSVILSVLIKYLQVPANGVSVTFGVTSNPHSYAILCKVKLVKFTVVERIFYMAQPAGPSEEKNPLGITGL